MDASIPKDPLRILKTVFGYPSFRSRQGEILENVLAGRNTLAILPTGAGKSLCFSRGGSYRQGWKYLQLHIALF